MKKYYELTDKSHQIYTAATLLNPTERMSFFRLKWAGEQESWQEIMEATSREVWQRDYSHLARKEEQQKKLTDYEEWRRRDRKKLVGGNEFTQYIMGTGSESTATELYKMVEYAYIVDFASVLFIYLGVRNTGEAGEKPLGKRVERVASRLFHNDALARGCMEAEEVFHGDKVRGLHVFRENQLSYNGFIGSRKALLIPS